jgi:transposase
LVQQKTANGLSIQNLMARNTGVSMRGNRIKPLQSAEVSDLLGDAERVLAVESTLVVMPCLAEQIGVVERAVKARVKRRPAFRQVLTVSGIGDILALTIMLETGDIGRFERVGHFASSGRCVESPKLSHGKRKGQGHTKHGHAYLAWAFVEAANFAVRDNPQIKRYDQRNTSKTNGVVAIKAVAHKLARACDDVLRDQVPFETAKAFG